MPQRSRVVTERVPASNLQTGLVLSGGGARAAYQVGVLRAVFELFPEEDCPFPIITGVSAGSINGAYLACNADQSRKAIAELWDLWASLSPDKVFRTDPGSLTSIGLKWIVGLGLSGLMGRHKPNYLLDTSPLRSLIESSLDFRSIHRNVKSGLLKGVAFSASSYETGTTITFFDGEMALKRRAKRHHLMIRERLSTDHVMASSAIPLFFPPIEIGRRNYGDGGVRFTTPLSPAIHLGAKRLLAVGIRHNAPVVMAQTVRASQTPSLADIAGSLLNAIFLDSLELDIERLQRINEILKLVEQTGRTDRTESFRVIPIHYIRPSESLADLAHRLFERFPGPLKVLLRGLGATNQKGWDFLSYLSFDQTYTRKLLELGYQDGLAQANELKAFLTG